MLAYVFWHWTHSPGAGYEALQREFQSSLAADPADGFLGSWVTAISGAPWAAAGGAAYEDWYLLSGSAAIDRLNAAAVTGGRELSHAAAAAAAQGGTAGLYLLRRGEGRSPPRKTVWFAKPVGWTYDTLYSAVEPLLDRGAALWGRQMVLGPTPEFCLHSSGPIRLPAALRAEATVESRLVWPAAAESG